MTPADVIELFNRAVYEMREDGILHVDTRLALEFAGIDPDEITDKTEYIQ